MRKSVEAQNALAHSSFAYSKFSHVNAFLEELRCRKVYRVAAGYAVVAWLIIQVAAMVFPVWDLPRWNLRMVIPSVLIGFPIALILAWAFDITPAPARAAATGETECRPRPFYRPRRGNLILLTAIGLTISAGVGLFLLPRVAALNVDKSIAVLPFDNFSDDPENAHFAEGLQDDVLTSLAKIGDLKVISHTSVMSYKGQGAT